jgi:hypothetical protein
MMMIGTMLGHAAPAHVEARHVGQAQVEQHQVGLPLGEGGQTGLAVGGLADLVPLVLEGQAQGEADPVVVLDEQQRVHGAVIVAERAPVVPWRVSSGAPWLCYTNRTHRAASCHRGAHMTLFTLPRWGAFLPLAPHRQR